MTKGVAVPLERPATAAELTKGVRRLFLQRRLASIAELTLANGRRADIVALGVDGRIVIVEVKSGPADFRADRKWREYMPYCDEFYFAVAQDGPIQMIPHDAGLIVADAYGAMISRSAPINRAQPARRRAALLAFARHAAEHLHKWEDPMAFDKST
jgi:hypothetical protein